MLKDLGFNGKITVYADRDGYNRNFINGKIAQHYEVVDMLDEYLYHRNNGTLDNWIP